MDSPRYEVFIKGETIDLCIPSARAITNDRWFAWFNETDSLQHTGHGIFPNTPEQQANILKACTNKDRLVLLVCRKDDQRAIGVVSLQQIDLSFRKAEIAIMIGEPEGLPMASLSSLEAMALLTEHGMQQMGLQRIHAGQVYPGLSGWNKLLELIGYKTEGISRSAFRRGHNYSDLAMISIIIDDFKKIVSHREQLWPSSQVIKNLIRKQPRSSFAAKLDSAQKKLENEHFAFLFE